MSMTLKEAVEHLRAAGLEVRRYANGDDDGFTGCAASFPHPESQFLSYALYQFFVAQHQDMWAANIIVDQMQPVIKADPDLSVVVDAVENFYALCHQMHGETEGVYHLIFDLQRRLPLVVEIRDRHTLWARLPLNTSGMNQMARMLNAPFLTYREEDFLIHLTGSQWAIDYRRGEEVFMTMPLLHFDEIVPSLRPFCGPSRATDNGS